MQNKVGDLQGKVGDVDTDQAGEMMDFFTTPVAGDKMIKIVYALTMLTCVALFLSALATAHAMLARPCALNSSRRHSATLSNAVKSNSFDQSVK